MPVFIAENATGEERSAAEELVRVLRGMSGLAWSVEITSAFKKPGFYVGHRPAEAELETRMKLSRDIFTREAGETGPDGFRVESDGLRVFIEGATPEATRFAVNWLLQHEGGVRWYAPGSQGENLPRRPEWSLPELHERHDPAYVSREISGLFDVEEKEWAQRNGLGGRLSFSHSLTQVFSPGVIEQHPEWAPQLQGKRYVPYSANEQNWQPNLALIDVAQFAAAQARIAFEQDPNRQSFSLGINDTVRFDQGSATRALVEPLHYFRGLPDYSPLVFTFMNRAAGSLDRSDRYLGCLAYFWCENVPPFPVHPNVMPYITTDRAQYFDRDYRAEDLALMERWGQSGVRAFGLWEYAYGRGFVIPRMSTRALADSIHKGWHHGARGYLAEVGPQWGFDAFKIWLLTQLLWDPDRSYEELAGDFFNGYYGAASARMRRFFERCEEQWMNQRGSPRWLKFYQQEDQALLFSEAVCMELNGLIGEAVRLLPENSVELARVNQTKRAFSVTVAYVAFDHSRRALAAIAEGKLPPVAELSQLIGQYVNSRKDFLAKIQTATEGPHPAMSEWSPAGFLRDDPLPRVLWLAGGRDISEPGQILDEMFPAETENNEWHLLAKMISATAMRGAPNLVQNSRFLQIDEKRFEPEFLHPDFGQMPREWSIRAIPTQKGRVAIVDNFSKRDGKAIRIEGARDTQVFQWVPVEPDCAYSAFAKLRGKSSPGCDSALFLTFLDEVGKPVGHSPMQALPKGLTDDWRISVLSEAAPGKARWVGIGIGVSGQDADDWLEATDVELKGCLMETVR